MRLNTTPQSIYINVVVVSKVIVFSNIMTFENLAKQSGYLLSFSRSTKTRNKVFDSVAIKKKKKSEKHKEKKHRLINCYYITT